VEQQLNYQQGAFSWYALYESISTHLLKSSVYVGSLHHVTAIPQTHLLNGLH
jgi:hypothetical protein